MPTQLTEYAVEKSTFAIVAVFTDEDGDAVTPDLVTWSLSNSSGTIINSLEDVSETPASTVTIVLSGDDLQLLDSSNDYEERHCEISAVVDTDLGDNLPLKDSATFRVLNLKTIA
jgi:hypothetical protein